MRAASSTQPQDLATILLKFAFDLHFAIYRARTAMKPYPTINDIIGLGQDKVEFIMKIKCQLSYLEDFKNKILPKFLELSFLNLIYGKQIQQRQIQQLLQKHHRLINSIAQLRDTTYELSFDALHGFAQEEGDFALGGGGEEEQVSSVPALQEQADQLLPLFQETRCTLRHVILCSPMLAEFANNRSDSIIATADNPTHPLFFEQIDTLHELVAYCTTAQKTNGQSLVEKNSKDVPQNPHKAPGSIGARYDVFAQRISSLLSSSFEVASNLPAFDQLVTQKVAQQAQTLLGLQHNILEYKKKNKNPRRGSIKAAKLQIADQTLKILQNYFNALKEDEPNGKIFHKQLAMQLAKLQEINKKHGVGLGKLTPMIETAVKALANLLDLDLPMAKEASKAATATTVVQGYASAAAAAAAQCLPDNYAVAVEVTSGNAVGDTTLPTAVLIEQGGHSSFDMTAREADEAAEAAAAAAAARQATADLAAGNTVATGKPTSGGLVTSSAVQENARKKLRDQNSSGADMVRAFCRLEAREANQHYGSLTIGQRKRITKTLTTNHVSEEQNKKMRAIINAHNETEAESLLEALPVIPPDLADQNDAASAAPSTATSSTAGFFGAPRTNTAAGTRVPVAATPSAT